ncbi:MAG TPA: hypothetical protein VMB27_20555 [Solirubrobacteraceae bacterium]|nr:hypothetical protein [Solirubrobacteraceae bacterium]
MHPTISQAVANQHVEDFKRAAREQQIANGVVESRRATRRGFSRYFSHTREGHIKSLRRTHGGTPGAGARLT